MLSEPSRIFSEPPIISAPFFLILIFSIRNPRSVHPQAQLGLGFASDTTASILLAVHLTRPRIGTLGNLPHHSQPCPGMPSVTPTGTCTCKPWWKSKKFNRFNFKRWKKKCYFIVPPWILWDSWLRRLPSTLKVKQICKSSTMLMHGNILISYAEII